MKLQTTDPVITTFDIAVNGSFVPAGTEGIVLTPPMPQGEKAIIEFQREGTFIVGEVFLENLKRKPNLTRTVFPAWLGKIKEVSKRRSGSAPSRKYFGQGTDVKDR
jgi:hypothetical protein